MMAVRKGLQLKSNLLLMLSRLYSSKCQTLMALYTSPCRLGVREQHFVLVDRMLLYSCLEDGQSIYVPS
jgi:hypothetical protein